MFRFLYQGLIVFNLLLCLPAIVMSYRSFSKQICRLISLFWDRYLAPHVEFTKVHLYTDSLICSTIIMYIYLHDKAETITQAGHMTIIYTCVWSNDNKTRYEYTIIDRHCLAASRRGNFPPESTQSK